MQLRDGEHRRVVNLRCCAAERTVVRIEREGACENSTRRGRGRAARGRRRPRLRAGGTRVPLTIAVADPRGPQLQGLPANQTN